MQDTKGDEFTERILGTIVRKDYEQRQAQVENCTPLDHLFGLPLARHLHST